MTNRSTAPRVNSSNPDPKYRKTAAPLDKGCELWAAYEWRFNLAKGRRLPGSTMVGLGHCQGSRIRRKVYTLTNRVQEFKLCRTHQVEVGTLQRVPVPRRLPPSVKPGP